MGNEPTRFKRNESLRQEVIKQVQHLPMPQQAFISACRNANYEQIESLIQEHVDPSLTGLTLCSPLHYVVCSRVTPGHVEVVKLLLRHGVSPLSTAKNGASCVHALVTNQENDEIALQFLDALIYDRTSANQLNIPDRDCNTPLHLAAELNREPLVFALLRKARLYDKICADRQNIKGELPLHLTQSPNIVRALLAHQEGVINTKNNRGRTPLHLAVAKKNLPLVLVLLDHKASPDVQDLHGFSPLSLVQQLSHKSEVDYLLENNLLLSRLRRAKEREAKRTEQPPPYFPNGEETGPLNRAEVVKMLEDMQQAHTAQLELLRLEYDIRIQQLQQKLTDTQNAKASPLINPLRMSGRNNKTS